MELSSYLSRDPDTVSDAIRRSIATGLAHLEAESINDVDAILDTVSDDPFFPLIEHGKGGTINVDLRTSTEEVHEYYSNRLDGYEIAGSQEVRSIATDWFYFRESVATLHQVGDVDGVSGTDKEFKVNSAVLFPTADDGIAGELVWTRYPFGDILTGDVVEPDPLEGPDQLPVRMYRNARNHEKYVNALAEGNGDAARECVADDANWLLRFGNGHESDRRHLRASGVDEVSEYVSQEAGRAGIQSIDIFNRVVTDWYVLAEYRMPLSTSNDPSLERRQVSLYPLNSDGQIRAELSEIRDTQPRSIGQL